MENWIQATAVSIRDKEVKRKSDGRSFTIYTIETDHGELTTSKRELAEHAFQYLHIPARYLVNIKQNGTFTNNYLEDIAPIPGGAAAGSLGLSKKEEASPQNPQAPDPVRGLPNGEASAPAPTSVVAETVPNTGPDPAWDATTMSIFRQTAAKVAGHVSRTPDEFWQNLDEIVAYFVDGSKPPGVGGS